MKSKKSASRHPQWENPVRAKLKKGQPVFGVTITVNNVETAAQAATLGFDFIWMEMEHAPLTLETVRNIVLATRGLPAVPFARPPVNQLWTAKRVLDAGVLGVVFPFTSSPELARQAVAACHYPTRGLRGSGADLAAFRWPAPQGYYDFADENVMVVTIIEDLPGLENVDKIAATPGIDVIFIGTSDLSFALGLRGNQEHPRLETALAKIVAAARRNGKFLGRPAGTPKQIRRFQKQGFLFFQARTETDFMAAGAELLLKPFGRKRQFAAGGGL
jgi:2-keto-3-deoxy-L-rhamnonate aldolase RhmA